MVEGSQGQQAGKSYPQEHKMAGNPGEQSCHQGYCLEVGSLVVGSLVVGSPVVGSPVVDIPGAGTLQ